jgi:hypothetical protein
MKASLEEIDAYFPSYGVKGPIYPSNPIDADIAILHSFRDKTPLPDWALEELAIESAGRIRRAVKNIKLVDTTNKDSIFLYLEDLSAPNNFPEAKPIAKRHRSVLDFYKRQETVFAVLAAGYHGLRGGAKFLVAQHYLRSIGIVQSDATIRKNFKNWRHRIPIHESWAGVWVSKIGYAIAAYRRGELHQA